MDLREQKRRQKQLEDLPWELKKHRSEYEVTAKQIREKFKPKKVGKIEVTLFELRDLVMFDSKVKLEPFVKFKVNLTDFNSVTKKGNNILWENPERFSFIILDTQKTKLSKMSLSVHNAVKDEKKKDILTNDLVGESLIPIQDIVSGLYDTPKYVPVYIRSEHTGEIKVQIIAYGFN